MKVLTTLLTVISVLVLFSCKKGNDNDPEILTPTPKNFKPKFLVKRTNYYPGLSSLNNTFYGEDSVDHSIYSIMDSTINRYMSWHYDANGRLVKVVYNNTFRKGQRDSIMISRPAANTFKWVYSKGLGTIDQTSVADRTVVISDLGSNRSLVTITQQGFDPSIYYEKVYLNSFGAADSSILRYRPLGPGVSLLKRELFYNPDQQINSQVTTEYQNGSPFIYVTTSAITRDNYELTYFHEFIDKLSGTDMAWLPYSTITTFNPIYQNEFTDVLMLSNGALLTVSSEIKKYENGVFVSNEGTRQYTYTNTYDTQDRITLSEEKLNNVLILKAEITYYD